jgi:hypothetical protein
MTNVTDKLMCFIKTFTLAEFQAIYLHESNPYGCHNRAPIVTVCKPTCQYTYTALGQADARCHGCKERHSG